MLITRIPRISGHRIFRDFTWPSDLDDFKRFNLIYGWNGTGKSTLCRLLRNLQRRAPLNEGSMTIRIDNRDVDGASFNSETTQLCVFNQEFVAENVFTAAKQLAPIYVIGKENIDKQDKLDESRSTLTQIQSELTVNRDATQCAIRAKDDFCISKARLIKETLGGHGNAYANYNKRNFRDRIEKMVSDPGDTAVLDEQEKERLLSQSRMSPKPRIEDAIYALPDFDSLSSQVSSLASRRVVSQVIDSLKSDPAAAEWVRQGLTLHGKVNDRCKFCDQPFTGDRLKKLEAHFSKELSQLITDIDVQIAGLESLAKTARQFAPPKKAEFYDDLINKYDAIASAATAICKKADTALQSLISALTNKKSRPFDTLEGVKSPPFCDAAPLSALESIIRSHNEACAQFESRIAAALTRLEEGYVRDALPEYTKLSESERVAQAALSESQKQEILLKTEIESLERNIVSHREPADELNADLRTYLGHGDLQCEVKEAGYIITRNGKIASELSEGERTAVALLYFLKSLNARGFDKSCGIVVLDDPVSSLDANALFNAFAYIKDRCKDVQQVFLLTHNHGFFRAVREWFKNFRGPQKREWRIFMLTTYCDAIGRCARLQEIDPLLQKYDSEYHYLFAYIHRLANGPDADHLEEYLPAPTIARRVLESFLAFRVPDKDSLHSRMQAVTCDDTLRSRIYRFVNTHAHKDGIGDLDDDLTILSETKAVLESVIEFMRLADAEHCNAMIRCVTQADDAT